MKYFIGAAVLILLVMISGHIATYIISGLLMFAGLVALCETIPLIRFIFKYTGNLVDLSIFALSVYGLSHMGATVAIGLSVCGLLFTIFYKPRLRRTKKQTS